VGGKQKIEFNNFELVKKVSFITFCFGSARQTVETKSDVKKETWPSFLAQKFCLLVVILCVHTKFMML
jgi:hypothetical protein